MSFIKKLGDKFVAMLKEKAQAIKIGCAYDPTTQLGPVVSAAHKEKICKSTLCKIYER